MTAKELIRALKPFNDNDTVVVEVFDMVANEDLYDFYIDDIQITENENEIRLSIKTKTQ